MRIIALFNQKGGVGKTTTAVNLGAGMAAVGKTVMLLDMDPQGNLSFHLGIEPDKVNHSIYDVLVNRCTLTDATYRVHDKLSVIPSTADLAGAEVELVNEPERELRLRNAVLAAKPQADFLIIDCPPSLGLLTLNSLCLAKEVIIPMQAHFLALQGMARLLDTCSLVQEQLNPDLRISGILFCQYEQAPRLTSEVTGEVDQFLNNSRGTGKPWSEAQVFRTQIRRNIRLAEAPSFNQSIFDYAPNSAGAADYGVLVQDILEMHAAT